MINPIWHLSTLGDPRAHRRQGSQPVPSRGRAEGVHDPRMVDDRLERLALVCMAMWSLIQSRTDLTEEDLLERVREIDLMDGTADNKITRSVARCGRCDRPVSSRHTRCIYCGSEQLIASAFDTI